MKNIYFCALFHAVKNKLAAYLLLSLMVYHSAGFYFVYELNRYLVKREMSSRSKTTKGRALVKIIVNIKSSSIKYTGTKEIEYRGKMFDIVCRTNEGNISTFYCLQDTMEDDINAGLAGMIKDLSKHLLIPVFGSIALLWDEEPLPAERYIEFSFIPFTLTMTSAFIKIPANPPEVS